MSMWDWTARNTAEQMRKDFAPHQREEGRIAYHDGMYLDDNPYAKNSSEWNRWRLGWANAERHDPLRLRYEDE